MIKLSLSFLAGVLAMAVVVYFANARFALPMFFAGVCAVVIPGIAFLSSVSRIRSFARFLNAFADGLASSGLKSRPTTSALDQEKVVVLSDPLRENVASALVNLGVRAKLADEIATQAVKDNREFDPAIRAALALVPQSKRRAS